MGCCSSDEAAASDKEKEKQRQLAVDSKNTDGPSKVNDADESNSKPGGKAGEGDPLKRSAQSGVDADGKNQQFGPDGKPLPGDGTAAAAAASGSSSQSAGGAAGSTEKEEDAAAAAEGIDPDDPDAAELASLTPEERVQRRKELREKRSRIKVAREQLARGLKVLDVLSSAGPLEETILLPVIQDTVELSDMLEDLSKSSDGVEDSEKAASLINKVGALMQQLAGIDPSLIPDAEGTTAPPEGGESGAAAGTSSQLLLDPDGKVISGGGGGGAGSAVPSTGVAAVAKAAQERKTTFQEMSSIDKQRRVGAISQLLVATRNCIGLAAEERLSQKAKKMAADAAQKQVTDTRGLPDAPTSSGVPSPITSSRASGSPARGNSASPKKSPAGKRGSPAGSRRYSGSSAGSSAGSAGGGSRPGSRGSPAGVGANNSNSRFSSPGGRSSPAGSVGGKSRSSGGAPGSPGSPPTAGGGKKIPIAPGLYKRPVPKPGAKPPAPGPKTAWGARSPSPKAGSRQGPAGMGAAQGRNVNTTSTRRGGRRMTRSEKDNLLMDMDGLFNPDEDGAGSVGGRSRGSGSTRRSVGSRGSGVSSRLTAPRRTPVGVRSSVTSQSSRRSAASSSGHRSTSSNKPPRPLDPRALGKPGTPPRRPASYSGGGGGGAGAAGGQSVVMRGGAASSAASAAAIDAAKRAAARVKAARSSTSRGGASPGKRGGGAGGDGRFSAASSASQIFPLLGDADNVALSAPVEELLVQLMHTGRLVRSRGFSDMPLEAKSHVLRMIRDLLMQCRAKSFSESSLAAATLEQSSGRGGGGGDAGINSPTSHSSAAFGGGDGGGGGSSSSFLRSTFRDSSSSVARRQAAIMAFVNSMERSVAAAEAALVKQFSRGDSLLAFGGPRSPSASLRRGNNSINNSNTSKSSPFASPLRPASSASMMSGSSRRISPRSPSSRAALADAYGALEAGDVNTGLSFEEQYRHSPPVRVMLNAFKVLMSADYVNALPFEKDQLQRLMKSQLLSAKKYAAALPEHQRGALLQLMDKINEVLVAHGMKIAAMGARMSCSASMRVSHKMEASSPFAEKQRVVRAAGVAGRGAAGGERNASSGAVRGGDTNKSNNNKRPKHMTSAPTVRNTKAAETVRRNVAALNESLVTSRKMLCSASFAIMSLESQQGVFELIEEQLQRTQDEMESGGAYDSTTAGKAQQLDLILSSVKDRVLKRHANQHQRQHDAMMMMSSNNTSSSIYDRYKPLPPPTKRVVVTRRRKRAPIIGEDGLPIDGASAHGDDEEEEYFEEVEEVVDGNGQPQQQEQEDDGSVPARDGVIGTWAGDGKSQLTHFTPTHWMFQSPASSTRKHNSSKNMSRRNKHLQEESAVVAAPPPEISISSPVSTEDAPAHLLPGQVAAEEAGGERGSSDGDNKNVNDAVAAALAAADAAHEAGDVPAAETDGAPSAEEDEL